MQGSIVADGLRSCGLQPRTQIVWVKQHFALSRGDYHWKHETCWYAVRDGQRSAWVGDRRQTTVWEIANNNPFGNAQREESGVMGPRNRSNVCAVRSRTTAAPGKQFMTHFSAPERR
jgi:hypothetical protein